MTEGLKKRGYMAEGIHGDLSQQKRDSVIRQFREGTIDILVATDVAARGLDISGVSHVYNYDMPQDPESYTHRVGRTGRAGKAGQAFTFVIPREMEHLHAIERLTKRKIARRRAPSLGEVLEGQQRLAIESLVEMTDNLEALAPFKSSAEELLNDTDSVTLLAAALKLLTKEPDTTPVNITEEKPLRVRRRRESGRSDRRRRDGNRRRDDRPRRSRDDRRSDRRNDRKGDRRRDDRKSDRPRGEKKTRHQSEGFKPYFKD